MSVVNHAALIVCGRIGRVFGAVAGGVLGYLISGGSVAALGAIVGAVVMPSIFGWLAARNLTGG